jgi:hypothetical protein
MNKRKNIHVYRRKKTKFAKEIMFYKVIRDMLIGAIIGLIIFTIIVSCIN